MGLPIRSLDSHGGEGDAGEDCTARRAGREEKVMLEVKGEGVGVVCVHMFNDPLLRGGVFGCLVCLACHCGMISLAELNSRMGVVAVAEEKSEDILSSTSGENLGELED